MPRCIVDGGVWGYWQDLKVACVWMGDGFCGWCSAGMMGQMASSCTKVPCVCLRKEKEDLGSWMKRCLRRGLLSAVCYQIGRIDLSKINWG